MGKGQASSQPACSEAIAGQEPEATGPGAPGTPTPTQKAHVGTGVRAEGAGGNGGNGSLRSAHSSLTSRKTWCFHSTVWKVEENAEFIGKNQCPKGHSSRQRFSSLGVSAGEESLDLAGQASWAGRRTRAARAAWGAPGPSSAQRRVPQGGGLPRPPRPQARGGNHMQLGLFHFWGRPLRILSERFPSLLSELLASLP